MIYCEGIKREGLRRTWKNLSQDSQSQARDSNQMPPEDKSKALPAEQIARLSSASMRLEMICYIYCCIFNLPLHKGCLPKHRKDLVSSKLQNNC
jgi:hypothetical protein